MTHVIKYLPQYIVGVLLCISAYIIYLEEREFDVRNISTTRYDVSRVFLNSPRSITAIMNNGSVKRFVCGVSMMLVDDVKSPDTDYIIIKKSTQLGTRGTCKSMYVHLKYVNNIDGGRFNKGKFGSDPVHPL